MPSSGAASYNGAVAVDAVVTRKPSMSRFAKREEQVDEVREYIDHDVLVTSVLSFRTRCFATLATSSCRRRCSARDVGFPSQRILMAKSIFGVSSRKRHQGHRAVVPATRQHRPQPSPSAEPRCRAGAWLGPKLQRAGPRRAQADEGHPRRRPSPRPVQAHRLTSSAGEGCRRSLSLRARCSSTMGARFTWSTARR